MKAVAATLLWLAVAVASLTIGAAPASAHTDFESSDPADGSQLKSEIAEIKLTYTSAAKPAGEGFVVLDSSGEQRDPDTVTPNADGNIWLLGFDPPLSDGAIGVRWTVQAPDTHPITGVFSFSITTASAAQAGSQPTPSPTPETEEVDLPLDDEGDLASQSEQSQDTALADFLSPVRSLPRYVQLAATLGRAIGLLGTALVVGGLAFARFILRADMNDRRSIMGVARNAAVGIILGTVIELVAQLATTNGSWSGISNSAWQTVLASMLGTAIGLRMVAGVVLALVANSVYRNAHPKTHRKTHLKTHRNSHPDLNSRRYHVASLFAALAIALLLISFTFDGHTTTEGNRWTTAALAMVHVLAGSVWAGGVAGMSVVLWHRFRRGDALRGLEMAVRFSVPAAIAVTVAGIGGSLLAATILNTVSDLWNTPWGRLLVAKSTLVTVAALIGGYNHFVVVPTLKARPSHGPGAATLRRTATSEAILLLLACVVTAALVGASAIA